MARAMRPKRAASLFQPRSRPGFVKRGRRMRRKAAAVMARPSHSQGAVGSGQWAAGSGSA
jgi:hypothetical protein